MDPIHDQHDHDHQHGAFRGRFDGPFGHRGPRGGFGGPWDGPAEALRAFKGFGPGPGFGPHGPRARRGDVRSAILGLLSDGPSNGYGLIKAIGERTEGAWTPSPGSVYPTLAQLVDEGLISQEGGPRGAYELTDAGRTYVEAHQEEIDAAFKQRRRPLPGRRRPHDGLRQARRCRHAVPRRRDRRAARPRDREGRRAAPRAVPHPRRVNLVALVEGCSCRTAEPTAVGPLPAMHAHRVHRVE